MNRFPANREQLTLSDVFQEHIQAGRTTRAQIAAAAGVGLSSAERWVRGDKNLQGIAYTPDFNELLSLMRNLPPAVTASIRALMDAAERRHPQKVSFIKLAADGDREANDVLEAIVQSPEDMARIGAEASEAAVFYQHIAVMAAAGAR